MQAFFPCTSFLITLLHINTIFIRNQIRDYLSIFRCSSSSKPGQCCLYTFGTTSELLHWLLFAKSEISAVAMHCADDRKCIYFILHLWSPQHWVWIYFRLPSQTMNVNLFLQQILCANKISKRNLVTVHSYWTSWLLNCMINGWSASHFFVSSFIQEIFT